jgi:hypothetical protein
MELEKSPAAGCSIFEACGLIERIRPYRLIEDLANGSATDNHITLRSSYCHRILRCSFPIR